jgi:hypothetical protein
MTRRTPILAIVLLQLLSACGGHRASDEVAHVSTTPVDELNALDPRAPVPLQPMMAWHQKQNMQEHLVAIQRITDALSREDWDAVSSAASMIALSPQMQMQCEHMGAGADGFTEAALDFHHRAEAIARAAEEKDIAAVLGATAHTLDACTRCHATYRQDVVDAATWESRTGSAVEAGAH